MTMMRLRREDPRVVGSFRLHRRLGAGGMGVVYLGSDKRGQRVALKVIRPELAEDQEFRHRFAREVSAARRIRGGCTARLVAADLEAERPWFATQYVPGPSLYDRVGTDGPLPAGEVASIGAALAEGLVAVHDAGVVHRDLKPSNILLSPKGPRIIDFGIAWATGASTLTHVGTAVGSPGFLAPEQVRGAAVTPATDVFAFGATLAYAAAADSPFGQGSSEVMLYRVVHEEPDLRGVPDSLAPLVYACLAKEPEDRPDTARLAERLAEIAAREARGTDPLRRGGPAVPKAAGPHPERPTGRRAVRYVEQRTERRSAPDHDAAGLGSGHVSGRESGHASGAGSGHGAGHGPGHGSASGSSGHQVPHSHAAAGHHSPAHHTPAGQGSPSGTAQRTPPPRPGGGQRTPARAQPRQSAPRTLTPRAPGARRPGAGRDGRLLRQRVIVFVTVTLLVALGIAVAQGCQGPSRGLRAPDTMRVTGGIERGAPGAG